MSSDDYLMTAIRRCSAFALVEYVGMNLLNTGLKAAGESPYLEQFYEPFGNPAGIGFSLIVGGIASYAYVGLRHFMRK